MKGERTATLHVTATLKLQDTYETTLMGETLMGPPHPRVRYRRVEGYPRRLHFPSGYGKLC